MAVDLIGTGLPIYARAPKKSTQDQNRGMEATVANLSDLSLDSPRGDEKNHLKPLPRVGQSHFSVLHHASVTKED